MDEAEAEMTAELLKYAKPKPRTEMHAGWTTINYQVDENCMIIGEARKAIGDFDHEFGVERVDDFEFRGMDVFVYIRLIPYNITDALKPRELDNFIEQFQAYAREEIIKQE